MMLIECLNISHDKSVSCLFLAINHYLGFVIKLIVLSTSSKLIFHLRMTQKIVNVITFIAHIDIIIVIFISVNALIFLQR